MVRFIFGTEQQAADICWTQPPHDNDIAAAAEA